MQIIKQSSYRQRVYQDPTSKEITLIYGEDAAPVGATLLADHDVMDFTTVTDHVETVTPDPLPQSAND